ncbi:hypothetical protein DJ010_09300 [Nocardioides silvaticus]|uniref:Uncharacterized protein n=1 Tax=Nocardioides silvaticus TaxID=2201891 RepID=A0A316TIE4_9ACTN|nr:hypothetical protein [Nocardioides silvaticus]PWN03301.1 hypothetical protein DJ010_09300 [Nocardioides silvaticus]
MSSSVYLAWCSEPVPADLPGPWLELRPLADGLVLVESDEGLSRVYHEIKWAVADGAALLVVPVNERPKLKGLPAGTTTWLRDRVPRTVTPEQPD